MASIYGFNRETNLVLKGLSNGLFFNRGNFPVYYWSGMRTLGRPIGDEL